MKIAVIGAGIFGCTSAIKLAQIGHEVTLFEKASEILQSASGINQYRLHRGYHYPRSPETVDSLRGSERSFLAEYSDAVIDQNEHYYCIAKQGSKTSPEAFRAFCKTWDFEATEVALDCVNPDSIGLIIRGREALLDPFKLQQIVKSRLAEHSVMVKLNETATDQVIKKHDYVVNCTYANLNDLLGSMPQAKVEYQFEVCEKPVLKLPETFRGKSIVIMDGPFTCIDPFGETGDHVIGNVVHAIHAVNVGFVPLIPDSIRPFLNKGVIKNPPITRIKEFIESAAYFMPEIRKAEHIGSMYTIRTVLPNVDHTDERPTLVRKINDKIINVFSGKIGTCVQAASSVIGLIESSQAVSGS